jgi:hypothetical protein
VFSPILPLWKLSVYILEVLLEGPWKGFFNLLKKSWKVEKWKKWTEAQRKAQEAWREKRKSMGKPVSTPEVSLSLQCLQASTPKEASMTISLAEGGAEGPKVQVSEGHAEQERERVTGKAKRVEK